MKRAGNLIDRIADADNGRLAFWKASKGKRAKADVLAFRADLDGRLRCLREKLLAGSIHWGPYRRFMIFDPKERMICAAPSRSRKRFRCKIAVYHGNYTNGRWTEEETARHVEPLLAFVRRAESDAFRRRVFESIQGSCPKEARTA